MRKTIAAVGAVMAFTSMAANATGTPFTGLLFSAWDGEVSYTADLGVTLFEFDATTNQEFALPGLADAFGGDLSGVRYSVVASDPTDLFSNFPTLLATGEVGPDLQNGANDGDQLVVFANAANNFRVSNNGICADASPCTAEVGDANYAGSQVYGANLGGSNNQLNVSGDLLGGLLPLVLLEGANFDFDNITVTSLGNFAFDGEALQYVIPVPAAGWLMVSGLVGLMGLRRRA